MPDIFLVPGVRTPFVKGGGPFAQYDALAISAPVAKAMAARAQPDFIVWEDAGGRWHEELSEGDDRPDTDVRG